MITHCSTYAALQRVTHVRPSIYNHRHIYGIEVTSTPPSSLSIPLPQNKVVHAHTSVTHSVQHIARLACYRYTRQPQNRTTTGKCVHFTYGGPHGMRLCRVCRGCLPQLHIPPATSGPSPHPKSHCSHLAREKHAHDAQHTRHGVFVTYTLLYRSDQPSDARGLTQTAAHTVAGGHPC